MRELFLKVLIVLAALVGFAGGAIHGATVASDAGYPEDGGVGASTTGTGFVATVDDTSNPLKTSVEVTGSLTYLNGVTLTGRGQSFDRLDWQGTISGNSARANWKVKLSGKLNAQVEILTQVKDANSTYSSEAVVIFERHCDELDTPYTPPLRHLKAKAISSIAPESWGPVNRWVEFKNPPSLNVGKGSSSMSADFAYPKDLTVSDATLAFYYEISATGDISTNRPEKEVKSHAWVSTPIVCLVEGYDGTTLIQSAITVE